MTLTVVVVLTSCAPMKLRKTVHVKKKKEQLDATKRVTSKPIPKVRRIDRLA